MTVDIRGTNSFNYGAQLMLQAAVLELSPEFRLSAPPQLSDFDVRAKLGLRQTLVLNQAPYSSMRLGNLVPSSTASSLGMVRHRDVTGVVDASGFAYSDSFSRRRIRREAVWSRGWRKRGVPVVLLPQAFGPFEDEAKRLWTERLLRASTLVFARDSVSQQYVSELVPDADVRRSPDFTIGLPAKQTRQVSIEPFFAVVPNTKIVTSGKLTEVEYLNLLSHYIRKGRSLGFKPVVLVHDAKDRSLSVKIGEESRAEVLVDDDPLKLKGYLAQAEYVISSRFHALVSALASGVPSLALGWSHKYEELLRDFSSVEWVASLQEDPDQSTERLLQNSGSSRERLLAAKVGLIEQNREMWNLTLGVLRHASADR